MGHQSGGPELPNISEALERGAAGPALPSQALLLVAVCCLWQSDHPLS